MKYYIIAGEASGDLHASHLITALKKADDEATFRFIGGDNMIAAAGQQGECSQHYKDIAYMGFIPVLMHLRTIFKAMDNCKKDIMEFQPDCVIFVDYAGFNLKIAKYLREKVNQGELSAKLFYYISPKIWAWKEYRIKNFKRDIDEMFSILPFEKEFFEDRHHYPIHYVGNPTADEIRKWKEANPYWETERETSLPTIAILPGSRKQEIKDNLPTMLEALKGIEGYRFIVAGAPGIDADYYNQFSDYEHHCYTILFGQTHDILNSSTAALVTSGTATLETSLFNVPQVVCYKTPVPHIIRWAFNHIIKCPYISLVNLIADREVVPELFAERFSVKNIRKELLNILPGSPGREAMLEGYREVQTKLGDTPAADNAARKMVEMLRGER
ncbi:MAG: lipid-A-disaccharide synthase [Prevotella sp.]|nr:lipid-A-disaccharide synthase [Prevotella sp.]